MKRADEALLLIKLIDFLLITAENIFAAQFKGRGQFTRFHRRRFGQQHKLFHLLKTGKIMLNLA